MANGESGSNTSLMVKINASNVGQVAEADALNEKREEYVRFKRVRSNSPPSGADGGTDDSCTHSRVNLKDDRSVKKIKLESPRSDAALLHDDHSNLQEGSGPMEDEEPTQDVQAETGAGDREVQGADAQEDPTLASDDEEYEYESGQWCVTTPETSTWETGIPEDWLLHPAVSRHAGLVVTVRGSANTTTSSGWHNGTLEGVKGIVLSVFNTGPNRRMFESTARVKFQRPLDPGMDILVVPVTYLWPVRPDGAGQEAVIIGGRYVGEFAKLREEVSGGWFVSAAYEHFEIDGEYLVRVLPVD